MTDTKTREDEIRLLLVNAAKAAIVDLDSKFKEIFLPDENIAMSALATLSRLKMLEAVLLKTMGEVVGLPGDLLRTINHDVGKNATLMMVSAGFLPAHLASAIYKDYGIDDVFRMAAAGPQPKPGDHAAALKDLEHSMAKVKEELGR
jgi:hypothetical protein